ncbi:hypothetical protein AADEFJLK_03143 [Methylovulum psychrotolerans]|uniref:Uncharacterized protein n=1 Tax=Methylovulum psychrotolerans TaxID=1704499 RepID=A0A2S5CK26_9GAMM|nr:hypothetical protein AADEFJLK_03143 [Methylovulum psychrotolerans]
MVIFTMSGLMMKGLMRLKQQYFKKRCMVISFQNNLILSNVIQLIFYKDIQNHAYHYPALQSKFSVQCIPMLKSPLILGIT